MDFNRSGQTRVNANQAPAAAAAAPSPKPDAPNDNKQPIDFRNTRVFRWTFIALLFSGTLLVVATLLFMVFGAPTGRESKNINKDEMQAVFVNVNGTNGGQVYFGHIKELNPQFIRLTNVFYIQNQQAQSADSSSAYNLVKLGCELHGPQDEMIINREQIFFWENLKNDSQVSQKAAEFYKQNPNGQKCSNNNGSATQQGASTNEAPGANGAAGGAATNGAATGTGAGVTPQGATETPATGTQKKQ